ncbi:MAG: HAMP domain-containing histidine kinase [Clostridiales bacterium]|nr:HAMP domain-containing histidine kinase [Clostridiales bacterium]
MQTEEITWLVQGWDFYPDQMIYPGDCTGESKSIYIGQYFSFAGLHEDGSPYGSGTYRLRVRGNGNYTMLIPEVFSACVVYVGGEQVTSSGSISPYKPYIKDIMFSFQINGEAEILIQTANYSHYYSGVTYPPAIGSSEAVSRLITIRMLFYGFLVFTSLALALFSAVIWCGTKKGRASSENCWLGILGLSFSLRVCYPFIHMLGICGGNLAYVLENTMTSLGLFCIAHTVSLICLKTNSLPERILKGVTGGFVLISLVFSFWMTKYLPAFVPIYGQILYWYKALIAITMTLLLIRQFMKRKSGPILLLFTGLFVYCLSLIFHALCLGRFEPAYTGWFEEWGTYILILCFAARMALRNMEIIRENRHLSEHLQEEIAHKTDSLSKLLEERRMLLSGFAHDLKTPITSITTFTRLVELDNTQLDEESRQYLDIIRRKTKEIQEQLSTINEFTHIDSTPPDFEPLDLCLLLRNFYSGNKPDINVSGISFELLLKDDQPVMISGDKRKLVSVLQNLVFNAVSFTPEGGKICLYLNKEQEFAVLCVKDTGSGISEEDIPYIFDPLFTNRINEKSSGMGLFIVKSIVTEHRGTIEVASVVGKGTVFTIKFPIIQ